MAAAPTLDFRNTNALWGSVLVETLVRGGVRRAVVAPGSRSTPLTFALARHPSIEAVPVLDERSAAFFALGLAKRSHAPVVLVCSSGTAAANFLPAIVEAHESHTPLLVLTADRPPELRDCASGQTIDQQKLFGGYVRFDHELAVAEPRLELLCYLRQTIAHAVGRATHSPQAGPVHLNAPFRDPLPPVEDASVQHLRAELNEEFFAHLGASATVATTVAGLAEAGPGSPTPATGRQQTVAWQRLTTTRGLIVAGPANPANVTSYVASVRNLAEGLGWPVLADALSPLRHHGEMSVPVVATYDAIVRDEKLARDLTPRFVLCLEGWPTSKALRAWLERSQAEIVLVAETDTNRDALHGRTRHLALAVESLAADGERGAAQAPARQEYAGAWRRAEDAARTRLGRSFAQTKGMFEGKATWLLAQHLPAGTPLFVASSMPVRDVEYFWPATDRRHEFFFNRGANGIDGTLSTALAVAHASEAPAVLLTGDLALLHDTNGFLLRPKLRGSLTIVLINNRGGGIFEHLPIAQFDPPFEEFFATPQEVDFARLAAAYGVTHELVRDWAHFSALISSLPASGVRVLELRTDRKRDAALRKRILAAAASGG